MTDSLTSDSLSREEPDWYAAAQALVDGCCTLATPELRVRFFDRVCLGLGDRFYPAFLKLLCIVSDHGDDDAKRAVARTLVHALSTGRMPSGRLSAWGGSTSESESTYSQTRSLGPIEYLCAWRAQEAGVHSLTPETFDASAKAVISLVSSEPEAKALYCAKLQHDIDDPLGGTFNRHTRVAMTTLLQRWLANEPMDRVVAALTFDDEAEPSLAQWAPPAGGGFRALG